MIALATGYSTNAYVVIYFGNTSPFLVSNKKMLRDQVNNLGSGNQVRGLYILSYDILIAALFDTSFFVSKIATINISNSKITFKETFPIIQTS
jgi:hypothetical protein